MERVSSVRKRGNSELRELERWLKGDRPVWAFVERQDVRRLAEQTWRLQGKCEEPGQMLVRVFVLDRWLEMFEIAC